MFVYQEGDSRDIGPVRSARIYFIHWASEVKAAIAHYGGDRRSRSYLRVFDHERFTNVDALGGSGKAFHRISHAGRRRTTATPRPAALRAMALKRGAAASTPADMDRRAFVAPSDPGVARSHAADPDPVPDGRHRVPVRPRERPLQTSRRRARPRSTRPTASVVTTRNVVVMFMSFRTDTKIEPGHSRPVVGSIGIGPRPGLPRGPRWSRPPGRSDDQVAPTRLLDASGNEIPLVRPAARSSRSSPPARR